MPNVTSIEDPRSQSRVWLVAVIVFVLGMIAVRATIGPSDLHDQTQPKTIAYTVSIVNHADDPAYWILPRELDSIGATKPPLYNWLAVPWVAITSGESEWAHKFPSIFAFLITASLIWTTVRKVHPAQPVVAFGAVLIFASNYMWFKLSYLARPDAVLTCALTISWLSVFHLRWSEIDEDAEFPSWKRRVLQCGMWGGAALGFLAKGPAAAVALLFPLLVYMLDEKATTAAESKWSRWKRGLIRGFWRTGARWGFLLALLPIVVWLYAAWRVDPNHVEEVLIGKELRTHLVGEAGETWGEQLWTVVRTLPNPLLFLLSRFAPWGVLLLLIAVGIWRKGSLALFGSTDVGPSESTSAQRAAYLAQMCIRYLVMIIALFSIFASHRPDYIAPVFPAASMLCAFWVYKKCANRAPRMAWVVVTASIVTVIVMATVSTTMQLHAQYPLAKQLIEFTHRVRPVLVEYPDRDVVFLDTGRNPLQSLLMCNQSDELVDAQVAIRQADSRIVWFFARDRAIAKFQQSELGRRCTMRIVAESVPQIPKEGTQPFRVTLFELTYLGD